MKSSARWTRLIADKKSVEVDWSGMRGWTRNIVVRLLIFYVPRGEVTLCCAGLCVENALCFRLETLHSILLSILNGACLKQQSKFRLCGVAVVSGQRVTLTDHLLITPRVVFAHNVWKLFIGKQNTQQYMNLVSAWKQNSFEKIHVVHLKKVVHQNVYYQTGAAHRRYKAE